jgi:ABC-type bacteriocin/lantibiotic exporter with double-glycine peptidase domain
MNRPRRGAPPRARAARLATMVARAAALLLLIAPVGAGCYTGSARGVASLPDLERAPGWVLVRGVHFVHQQSEADCGAAAMAMALSYWGQPTTLETVVAARPPHDGGIAAGELRDLARARGLQAFLVPGTFIDLETQLRRGRPVVVGLAKPITGNRAVQHYEVVIGLNRTEGRVLAWDPAQGLRENSVEGFAREWIPAHQLALIMFPRPADSQQTPTTRALPATDETTALVTAP